MNKKRILMLALSLSLLICLCSCKEKPEVTLVEVSESSADTPAAAKAESEVKAEPDVETKVESKEEPTETVSESANPSSEPETDEVLKPHETQNPAPEYQTIESGVTNFSFECRSSYEYKEEEDGQLQVFLVSGQEYPCLSVSRIYDGRDAVHILKEDASEINDTFKDQMKVSPSDPELTDVDGRDVYSIRCEYVMDSADVSCVEYAEDYQDGTVLCYKLIYPSEYKDSAEEAAETALHTIWVGELDEDLIAEAQAATPEPANKTTAGRWTISQKELSNGNVEFCIDDCLIMEVPGSWKEKAFWADNGNFLSFYHKASYDKIAQKGYLGGCLFSIIYYSDDSYQVLPSYDYIGPSADGGHYVMAFPTDVQGYMEDEKIREEWEIMYDEVEYIRDHVYSMIFS